MLVGLEFAVPDEALESDPPDCPEVPEDDEADDAGGWKGTASRRSSAIRCSKPRASWASVTCS